MKVMIEKKQKQWLRKANLPVQQKEKMVQETIVKQIRTNETEKREMKVMAAEKEIARDQLVAVVAAASGEDILRLIIRLRPAMGVVEVVIIVVMGAAVDIRVEGASAENKMMSYLSTFGWL